MNAITRWSLTILAVAGLAVDAYTHLDLASQFDPVRTSAISEGDLFRIEGGLAIAAAVLLVAWNRWWTQLVALAVAGGGLAVLLIYRYVEVGRIGILPDMSDPQWYAEKAWSAIGEGVAVVATLALLAGQLAGRRRNRPAGSARVATLAG